ncbi:hypothetical protein Bpfe_014365 [Biomphalaria pfeifferi]|uniref:Uncharacterized protein n=1 Tax=Biomphalaria pfeifferi TaxID=112525 RepID=A0AAD8BKJ8_BIOPF|nr:hypothetical protein Bpfe_014365 [Biomphalaria pfeifferi]
MSQWMRDERDTNDNPNCSCTIIIYLMAYIFILFFNSCFANVHQLNSWSPIKSFRLALFTDSCFELVDLQLHLDELTATNFYDGVVFKLLKVVYKHPVGGLNQPHKLRTSTNVEMRVESASKLALN